MISFFFLVEAVGGEAPIILVCLCYSVVTNGIELKICFMSKL